MRHDLGLRRMIRRFNADNAILQVRMVVADMLGQFILADPVPRSAIPCQLQGVDDIVVGSPVLQAPLPSTVPALLWV
ncbi:hypothetical protein EOA13_15330 [Mesorhizobium sp. M7A.F.Ca.US.011.01.1.1]|uniref:hypothetical protein n=1 Tax=Mesorhizobium sp. M7A.F.Ca.US.011.01.1.1 TaxID=2496741 RepID=UPI000FCBF5A3|nr:hypothetical protein [Mesorhizobium sp. M7A.F.Ca.US.011.01.1.1]RUX28792.1 hypothetical protein EOA13_15330 [Mesorhizobium sp. M7A.F.Ca.US.011.01.1.1]